MVKQLVKGEKVVINKIDDYSNNLTLKLIYENKSETAFAIDLFVFIINENNKINKKDIVYYNNPENSAKSIRLIEAYEGLENEKKCEVDLNNIPKSISKLVLGCSVYKAEGRSTKISPVNIEFKVSNTTTNTELFNFSIEIDITSSEAVVIGEIYKHNEFWKFNATQAVSGSVLLNLIKTIYNVNLI